MKRSTGPHFQNEKADTFVRKRQAVALRAWRDAVKVWGRRDVAVFLLHPDDEIAQAFVAPQGIPLVRPLIVAIALPDAIAWLNQVGEHASADGFARDALYPNVGFVALAFGSSPTPWPTRYKLMSNSQPNSIGASLHALADTLEIAGEAVHNAADALDAGGALAATASTLNLAALNAVSSALSLAKRAGQLEALDTGVQS